MRLSPGDIVAGSYQLEELLGSGASGSVWKCRDLALGRVVALKVLHAELLRDPAQAERFQREARLLATLDHPGLVTIYASLRIEDELGRSAPAIVMPYVPGRPLSAALEREGPFEPARAVRVLRELLEALAAAHAVGVVHRDLKPQNVLLEPRASAGGPAREVVRLLDFGIARTASGPVSASSMLAAQVGLTLGTPGYISPEQISDPSGVDARADLWAAAVCLYELLTGALPFEGAATAEVLAAVLSGRYRPVSALRPLLPSAFDAFFARAFARTLAQRFDDAASMRQALDGLLAALAQTSAGGGAASEGARGELSKATLVGHSLGALAMHESAASSGAASESASGAPSVSAPPWVGGDPSLRALGSSAKGMPQVVVRVAGASPPPAAPPAPSPEGALSYVRSSAGTGGAGGSKATIAQLSPPSIAPGTPSGGGAEAASAANAATVELVVPREAPAASASRGVLRAAALTFAVTLALGLVGLAAFLLAQR